jgi:hypothetical protein
LACGYVVFVTVLVGRIGGTLPQIARDCIKLALSSRERLKLRRGAKQWK